MQRLYAMVHPGRAAVFRRGVPDSYAGPAIVLGSVAMLDGEAPSGGPTGSAVGLAELLQAGRRGEAWAFDELYRRFVRVVHGIALSQVGPGEAEDVAQETFLAVVGGLAGVRDPVALPGWICTIARNTALAFRRRRARRPVATTMADCAGEPPRDDGRELRERVLARVCELPESYRETLVLRLIEGLTGPEIAERTGMTAGSVRVNLTRGMALLRPRLEEEGWP